MPLRTTLLADRYRLIERVGSGGMATVLLAEDERLGRQVAVKLLHAESPEDTARRFRREARLGASLNHPNLVAVYDIVTDEEGVLIVMEYVPGETLRDAIDRGPLYPARALEILRGVAAALDHAHAEGIVHRDVKPANVLLGRDGRTVKLADLGIATAVEGTRITRSGTVLGTAAYMAPEQLEGHTTGPPADVYALAILAWEALSGRRAYEGRTPLEIAHRKAAEPPPSLTQAWPAAPPAAAGVLERAMSADPSRRPASATALVDELERALGGRNVAHAAELPRLHRTRAVPVAALIAALLVAGVAAALLTLTGRDEAPGKQASAPAKKSHQHSASGRKPAAHAAPAPASSSAQAPPAPASTAPAPGAPAPAAPAGSGYKVPQPAGTSAARGQQLNTEGKALSDRGDYAAAIPTLERAVRAFPAGTTAAGNIQYAYTLFNLGHALLQAGRAADAVPVLEQRLQNPDQRTTVQAELDRARAAAGNG